MTLIHRQDDNGNQPPPQDGGGDQPAGNGGGGTQPSDGGQSETGQASLPFVDASTTPVTPTTATRALAASGDPTATGFIPVGSGVAQNPSVESTTALSGTLTVNVSSGTAAIAPGASITPQSGSQQVTALGLSLPVLIGIIAGVFAFLLIVLIIVIVLYRRAGRKRRAQNSLHSHDTEGLPYAGGGGRSRSRSKDELTPPPTPAPLSHKALMQEKQRDLAALDALVSALDQAQSRSGAQRYDPSRSGPGAGSVAKLKAASAANGTRQSDQSDFIEWDDEDESSEFDTKRRKRRTVDELPDADVFRAAIAPKTSY